jgi:hypothetical protein
LREGRRSAHDVDLALIDEQLDQVAQIVREAGVVEGDPLLEGDVP